MNHLTASAPYAFIIFSGSTTFFLDFDIASDGPTKTFSPFEIFNQDILKTNLQELGLNNPKVIGNIPYNITSPIIFWLIDHLPYWSESYLMVQKEVAQRLIADIGTKDYSRITVMTGLYFNIKIL